MIAEQDKDHDGNSSTGSESSPARTRHVTVTSDALDSRELFAGARELTITHGSDVYRLRLTSQNKLILTK
jgi:hemin uptake protein HemP